MYGFEWPISTPNVLLVARARTTRFPDPRTTPALRGGVSREGGIHDFSRPGRKPDAEDRALTRCTLHAHFAAPSGHRVVGRGQTKPTTGIRLRGEESLKHATNCSGSLELGRGNRIDVRCRRQRLTGLRLSPFTPLTETDQTHTFHAMNEYRSPHETITDPLPRAAGAALEEALGVFPVVVVIGARQTGKTTLVRNLPALSGHAYRTLDDPELRGQARQDPASVLAFGRELILDEVQRAPDLLSAVKVAVDQEHPRRPGRFVLTGSANLLLMERIAESLAGRAAYVRLWPLTRRERRGLGRTGIWGQLLDAPRGDWPEIVAEQGGPPEDWRRLTAEGGLPVPAHELRGARERALWFDGYVATYLERDLQTLARIEDLGDFRRLMRAAVLRLGQVTNQADLARDVGISRPTAHRWLNLLETSFQLLRVGPYAVNRTKRLVKSPRLYWSDVGLARHIAGGEPSGAHLENLVLTDLVAWRELVTPRPEILFWRTANGEEVDFVIEAGSRVLPIEVKATERPGYGDARHLRTFRNEYGDAVHGGLLLHCGEETFWLSEGILAAPWWRVM